MERRILRSSHIIQNLSNEETRSGSDAHTTTVGAPSTRSSGSSNICIFTSRRKRIIALILVHDIELLLVPEAPRVPPKLVPEPL